MRRGFRRLTVYDQQYDSSLLRSMLDSPDSYLAGGSYEILYKDDRTTTVAMVHGDDQRFVIKRYNTKNPWHAVRRAVRTTRAQTCWRLSHRFLETGLFTPPPVAMVEERIGPLRQRSYYITEHVRGVPFTEYLEYLSEDSKHDDIVGALGELFFTMLKFGLSHGDMKANNLLVIERRVMLLDLDAAKSHRTAFGAHRAYRRDRSRFLRNLDAQPVLRRRFDEALPRV